MAMKIGAARCATFFGVRGPGRKVGFFSCDFAEPFLEVFSTVIFFLGGLRFLRFPYGADIIMVTCS